MLDRNPVPERLVTMSWKFRLHGGVAVALAFDLPAGIVVSKLCVAVPAWLVEEQGPYSSNQPFSTVASAKERVA